MCDAAQEDMPLRRTVDKSKFCIKCKTQTPKVLIRHSKFCKECFIFNFTGKFRTVLSKSPALNDKTKKNAIVAISGGPSSRALLHLVKQFCLGINKATPKDGEVNVVQKDKNTKLGKVTVVHIDESAINPNHEALITPLKEMVADYGFDFKLIPIETVMDDFIPDNNASAGDNKEKLQNLLKSTSQSTRDDLIISFKMELIKNLAAITSSNLLLMGDCSTRIAIKTIGLTSEGRGFNIPFETCVENSIHEGITILRPLKDVILKEVAFYNHYLNLFVPPLFQTHATKASILKLTEHFLIGLDRSFPSTVSTVCRTASKLQPNPIYKELNNCEFCGNFIEPGVMEWRKGITVYTNTNNTDNSSVKEEDITPETEFNKNLCYGCQTNLLEIKSNPNNSKLDLLPSFITKQSTRESMKDQIKYYFL